MLMDSLGNRVQDYDLIMGGQGENGEGIITLYRWVAETQNLTQVYGFEDIVFWPGGEPQPPDDAPSCGWENEFCPDRTGN